MKHSIEKPGDFERKARKWLKLAVDYMVKPKTVKIINGRIYQIKSVLETK